MTPELEESFQETEASFTSLKDKGIELTQHLADNLSETENYLLNEITTDLETHQLDVEQQGENWQAYISQVLPEISDKVTELTDCIDGIVDQITGKLQEVGDATEESAQDSMQFLSQFQEEGIGQLLGRVGQLKELMEKLTTSIDTTTEGVVTVKDTMVDAAETVNVALEAAVGILEDLKSLFFGLI